MSEMVERVAKALAKAEADRLGFPVNDWRPWSDFARAAIDAMREPTDKMQKAGLTWSGDVCWKVMIDAALRD